MPTPGDSGSAPRSDAAAAIDAAAGRFGSLELDTVVIRGVKAPRHRMDDPGAGLVLLPMRGIGG
jgi:hypothetical protein